MDKLAQRRSLRSKVWEKVNLPGKALEKIHPELAEVMEAMRTLDEEIRTIADDVKPLIRQAKSDFRRRDYLNAAHSVSIFHNKCRTIGFMLARFVKNTDIKHYKYLLDNFDPAQQEHLFKYDPNADIKEAARQFNEMTKVGGPMDTLKGMGDWVGDTASNVFTGEGRAKGSLYEKLFNKSSFLKKLASGTEKVLSNSIKMLNQLLISFSILEKGVSRRNVNIYLDEAKKYVSVFDKYHDSYMIFDKEILAPIKEHAKEESDKKALETKKVEEAKAAEKARREAAEEEEGRGRLSDFDKYKLYSHEPDVKRAPSKPSYSDFEGPPEPEPTAYEMWGKPDSSSYEMPTKPKIHPKAPLPLAVETEDEESGTDFVPKVFETAAHSTFLNSLIVTAETENSSQFVQNILDYSEKLEAVNEGASAELLAIANEIIEKDAGIFDFLDKDKKKPVKEEVVPSTPAMTERPADLEEQNFYKRKKIEVPVGQIDKAFTNIPTLKTIPANMIRATAGSKRQIIQLFVQRLLKLDPNVDDISHLSGSFETRLIPLLGRLVHAGWVTAAHEVNDGHNPQDRIIESYVHLKLSDIHPDLSGTAKLNVFSRLSADNGTLTLKTIQKNFPIDGIVSAPSPDDEDGAQHWSKSLERDDEDYGDPNDDFRWENE